MYAKVKLSSKAVSMAAVIEPLPESLQGLAAESLQDLSWTDASLGLHGFGYWPVQEVYPDRADYEFYDNTTIIADKDVCRVLRQWSVKSLQGVALQDWFAQQIRQLFLALDEHRGSRIASGMPYTFPDSQTGTIQLRDDRDILNVNAVGTAASLLLQAGDNETKLDFRDQEDVTHSMTPTEFLQLAQQVMAWISAHYAAAWSHKDKLKELAEIGDTEAVAAYDISLGWPTMDTLFNVDPQLEDVPSEEDPVESPPDLA